MSGRDSLPGVNPALDDLLDATRGFPEPLLQRSVHLTVDVSGREGCQARKSRSWVGGGARSEPGAIWSAGRRRICSRSSRRRSVAAVRHGQAQRQSRHVNAAIDDRDAATAGADMASWIQIVNSPVDVRSHPGAGGSEPRDRESGSGGSSSQASGSWGARRWGAGWWGGSSVVGSSVAAWLGAVS